MKIALNHNQLTEIDDEDFDRVNRISWYANWNKRAKSFYVRGREKGTKKIWLLHRYIINAKAGEEIDHIDHNTLNNKKSNLRIVTHSQNIMNSLKKSSASSVYKGVRVYIRYVVFFRKKYIGLYDSEKEAAMAYDKAAYKFDPIHCSLNFPQLQQCERPG
jgi:hypothetical protein